MLAALNFRILKLQGYMDNVSAAVALAQGSEAVVLMVGLTGKDEGEGHDRVQITLEPNEQQLVAAVLALRKPTVLVTIHVNTHVFLGSADSSGMGMGVRTGRRSRLRKYHIHSSGHPFGKLSWRGVWRHHNRRGRLWSLQPVWPVSAINNAV